MSISCVSSLNGIILISLLANRVKVFDREAGFILIKCLSELFKDQGLIPSYFDWGEAFEHLLSFKYSSTNSSSNRMLCFRNFALTSQVLHNFLSASHIPCERSFNKAISVFIDSDYDEKAQELILKAYNQGQKMDLNAHLKKLLLLQKMNFAKEIILALKVQNSETIYLWDSFISHCCQKGLLDVLLPLLKQVAKQYKESKPDFVSSVFKSYEKNLSMSKNLKALMDLIAMILENNVPLSQETVRSIIKNVKSLSLP